MSTPTKKLITNIHWDLNDFCKSECSYCPTRLRGGDVPHETKDYIRVANVLIDTYASMGREISWVFNGGEPLDMDDIVVLLKLCRTSGSWMTLHTNGGKLWMDWWAIEPYVDKLFLTYHYWQNPQLINYIIETFQNKEKKFEVTVPIRTDGFDEDMLRADEIEKRFNIKVVRSALYHYADKSAGFMYEYSRDQLYLMSGMKPPKPPPPPPPIEKPIVVVPKPVIEKPVIVTPPVPQPTLVKEEIKRQTTTWHERHMEAQNSSPSFTGQLCNIGIERLNITHQGWVTGSDCNNLPLGNIWQPDWAPPAGPQTCTKISCTSASDQQITKFPLNAQ